MLQQNMRLPDSRIAYCPWLKLTVSISLALALLFAFLLFIGGAPWIASAAMPSPHPDAAFVVALAKSVDPTSVASGQSLMYTVTVTNVSPVSSTVSLFVTDTVPANTSFQYAGFVAVSGTVAVLAPGGTGVVTWTPNVQLAPSDTLQVWLQVKVASGLRDGTVIVNGDYGVSEAQSGVAMGTPVTATVQAPALTVAKQADRSQVCDGAQVGYTIRVTNTGHLTSNGPFTVTDRLPANTFYAGASPAAIFDAANGLITWTLAGPLAPAQAATVSFTVTNPVTTPFGMPVVNTAYSAIAPDVPDMATGTPVTVTAINVRASFTVTPRVQTGDPVIFTNTSTGTINYYLWDFGDGSINTSPNPTHTYPYEGNYTVTLRAFGPCGESVAQQPLMVVSFVALSKTVNPERVAPGGTLLYTLTITNTSAVYSTNALVVADVVPANTTFESAGFVPPASGTIAVPPVGGTGVVTWTPGVPLAPGGLLRLLLQVRVAPNLPAETVIVNDAYLVSEARSGIITGNPVTAMVVAPSSIAVVVKPPVLPITSTATLTATVYDDDGLPVIGQWVSLTTPDALGVGAIQPPFALTGPNGRVTAVISSTLPGVKRIVAATGSMSATAFITFTVQPGEPYSITMTVDPASPWITETARLTTTVTRQDGQPLQGLLVTFSSPDEFGMDLGSAIVPLSGTTDVSGQVTATLSSSLFGDKHIVATVPNGVANVLTVDWRTMYYLFLPIVLRDNSPPIVSYSLDR